MAFHVSALLVNTFLSYLLPRIFAEAPRRDIYELPSLGPWVVLGKHSATLIVSVGAGVFTGQYFLQSHLSEGRPGAKLQSKSKDENGGGDRRGGGGVEARNPFQSYTASHTPRQRPSAPSINSTIHAWTIDESSTPSLNPTIHAWMIDEPSTPPLDPTIQDWTIYEERFGKPPPFAFNDTNDESDRLSQSLADDASEWNSEFRQWYDPQNGLSFRACC